MKIIILGLLLGFGLIILFISTSRASLENVFRENMGERSKVDNYHVSYVNSQGETKSFFYPIPKSGMISKNPLYFLKEIRNKFWLLLTRDPEEKTRLIIFLADKKIAEAIKLLENKNQRLGFQSGKKAVENLSLAWTWGQSIRDNRKEIKNKILDTNKAYLGIITMAKEKGYLDEKDYEKIKKDIEKIQNKEAEWQVD